MARLPVPDEVLTLLGQTLRTLAGVASAARPSPVKSESEAPPLSEFDRKTSGSLMRVNHVGEVCAQALYRAQALTASTPELRQHMAQAAQEEVDHLAWTRSRLDELDARPSLLNPVWYAGAFAIGALAGALGDRASLGFVVETERQVERHLAGHLERLPPNDRRSRVVVEQMRADEARHAQWAEELGARPLPGPARELMRMAARVMTTTAERI